MKATFDLLLQRNPQLFSAAELPISHSAQQAMAAVIAAIETVIAMPGFQARALAQAPALARVPVKSAGVFMGYDFHLTEHGPQLIEINTNAGGGLLNAYLLAAWGHEAEAAQCCQTYVQMFRQEWALECGEQPLRRIAIVDEAPAKQFLAPEFELFQALFEAHGIAAVIADPAELSFDGQSLKHQGETIDLVYNRLTDFALDANTNAPLRAAFEARAVVLTPHPRAHALYADKRNLMLLSNFAALRALDVPDAIQKTLVAHIPQTVAVQPDLAEVFWSERKRWFFKPPAGFGSRAAYRGDKLTRRVFEEILHGGYIAQEIALPSEHPVPVAGERVMMKADIRCYVYQGRIQLSAARLYQGQTTNFRTPGGGFAPVFVV